MSLDTFISIPATIGGGFITGLFLGYALKKIVTLIAVVVGLFIAGLVYLQYQQIAYFEWDKIERAITTISGNVTGQLFSNQDISSIICTIKPRYSIGKRYVCRFCSGIYEGISKFG